MTATRGNAVVLGASREGGTGWAIAEAIASRGMHVTVGARSLPGIEALAARVNGRALQCDATVESELEAFVAAVTTEHGPIDSAVLAAGGGVRGMIDSMPDRELHWAFALNLYAPVYFLRHIARGMRDGGSVVLMSSISATNPWPGYFAYGSAKAALNCLVKYAALEYAPRGIRVNVVCPGPIDTSAASALLEKPHMRAALMKEVPLGAIATTRHVAEAIAWFASDAHAITGECMHVDGGQHLRRPPFPDELEAAAQRDAAPQQG
jgi:3-oxoacyl-[acyl-carrier protein] reductase